MVQAAIEDWSGEDTSVAEIERELSHLRETSALTGSANMRTSVMTHCAWVPPRWLDAAEQTLAGLAERHPSRTLLLVPLPEEPDGLDAKLAVRCFRAGDRHVCGEVIELRLRGNRVEAPASIVLPLLISDLPVFCRWRGEPPFGEAPWDQLLDLADRVVVDSSEWDVLRYHELAESFDQTAVSDIAWARSLPWRVALARRWPEIAEQEVLIAGPPAEAALLHGWLSVRLGQKIPPVAAAADISVELDGERLPPPRDDHPTPSDLLSDELDSFGRDRTYEEAVVAAA